MSESVIVISNQNIFAEGVVSRLRQHSLSNEIHFVDWEDSDYIQQVVDLNPSVIMVDSAEDEDPKWCLLSELLNTFPSITIVRLKLQEKDVQVITSSSEVVVSVQDLIELIWREES